ncbi:hypothetical protein [Embleya sp. NPDC059237]|uniref:hypothetical protein n=1 Tax=Embleya sp. NPDC059237 TaxID=3346784 RepID=UPI0036CE7951
MLFYPGTAAGGFSLGPVIRGLLTTIGWRQVFFVPVVLTAVILALALAVLPRDERPERRTGASMWTARCCCWGTRSCGWSTRRAVPGGPRRCSRPGSRCCSPSWRWSVGRRRSRYGWASCAPGRCCGRTWGRCCSAAHSSSSSSSRCSTCRRCAVGRRWRPASRCLRWGWTRYSRRS